MFVPKEMERNGGQEAVGSERMIVALQSATDRNIAPWHEARTPLPWFELLKYYTSTRSMLQLLKKNRLFLENRPEAISPHLLFQRFGFALDFTGDHILGVHSHSCDSKQSGTSRIEDAEGCT